MSRCYIVPLEAENHPLFKVLGAGLGQSRIPWSRGQESGHTISRTTPRITGQTTLETEKIEIEY